MIIYNILIPFPELLQEVSKGGKNGAWGLYSLFVMGGTEELFWMIMSICLVWIS